MDSLLRHEFDKLTGAENWRAWKRQVLDALTMRDVYERVTGDWTEPTAPLPNADATKVSEYVLARKKFRVAFSTARTIIWSALSSKVQNMITNYDEPKDMWDKLLEIFEQKTSNRLRKLLAQLMRSAKSPDKHMATHIAQLCSLWVNILTTARNEKDVTFDDCLLVASIFESLPKDEYREFGMLWDTLPEEKQTAAGLERLLVGRATRDEHAFE